MTCSLAWQEDTPETGNRTRRMREIAQGGDFFLLTFCCYRCCRPHGGLLGHTPEGDDQRLGQRDRAADCSQTSPDLLILSPSLTTPPGGWLCTLRCQSPKSLQGSKGEAAETPGDPVGRPGLGVKNKVTGKEKRRML